MRSTLAEKSCLDLTNQSALPTVSRFVGILLGDDVLQFSDVLCWERVLTRTFDKKSLVPSVWAQ
jgi:hypothetical protein